MRESLRSIRNDSVLSVLDFVGKMVLIGASISVSAALFPILVFRLQWFDIFKIQLFFIATYAFIDIVFAVVKPKMKHNEGFFFMGALLLKLLLLILFIQFLIGGEKLSGAIVLVSCYIVYLVFYISHFIRILRKNQA